MDKLILKPQRIRCHGNIIDCGEVVDDYTPYNTIVKQEPDIIDGYLQNAYVIVNNFTNLGFFFNEPTRELWMRFKGPYVRVFRLIDKDTNPALYCDSDGNFRFNGTEMCLEFEGEI